MQAKAEQVNKAITYATLFMIATNAMLSTEQFLRANEDWEDLDVSQLTWAQWNTNYCATAKKETIKRKYISRKY